MSLFHCNNLFTFQFLNWQNFNASPIFTPVEMQVEGNAGSSQFVLREGLSRFSHAINRTVQRSFKVMEGFMPLWLHSRLQSIITSGLTLFSIDDIGTDTNVLLTDSVADNAGNMPSWTDTFFGPKYFELHPLYKRDRTKSNREVDFIVSIAERWSTGRNLLDLCCGYGRHAIELARRGFTVTGIDRSSHMLQLAEREAVSVEGVKFENRDMRSIGHVGEFDMAISIFSSFGLLENDHENEMVIASLSKAMRAPNAILILDILNRDEVIKKIRELSHQETTFNEDGVVLVEDYEYDERTKYLKGSKKVLYLSDGRLKTEGTFVMRLYSYEEIKQLLEKYGMKVVDRYGGLDIKAAFSNASTRMVLVAKKG